MCIRDRDGRVKSFQLENDNWETQANIEEEVAALIGITNKSGDWLLVTGGQEGKLSIIDPDFKMRKSRMFSFFKSKIVEEKKAHSFAVMSIKWMKSKNMLITCGKNEQNLKLWGIEQLELLKELKICRIGNHINCIEFEETLGLILIGISDESLVVINTNFQMVYNFQKEQLNFTAICLNPETYQIIGGGLFYESVSYTHLRAHETGRNLVCRLLLEKKKKQYTQN
eukprot:TRINITY_DN7831_c0_g1_i4.p1 TRINITY_DN7831_c0_g1~~TRINITY_DN7831_c0_g1_i4.p1  ORF type:complete len:226 (-),score=44.89 TRINITY_DN7831_c0_g1_i4:12-689(-)